MPLSSIQTRILLQLASHRDPESYVAGATPLNRDASRYSADIDIFHDREDRVSQAALADAATLEAGGYQVQWIRQSPLMYAAQVSLEDDVTRLEWVADSDFRFFPVMRDDTFGYLLHPVDLGTNKVMAAAGRREVRDIVDVVMIHKTILPLGALVWAAVEKSPGFTPEGLIAEIRRNSNYPLSEWNALVVRGSLDPKEVLQKLRAALDEAEAFVAQMPTDLIGLLFLEGNKVVQPDPARLAEYQTHAGQRRGHWPSSFEISAAMLRQSL